MDQAMVYKLEQVLEKLEALDANQKSIIDQQAHFEKRLTDLATLIKVETKDASISLVKSIHRMSRNIIQSHTQSIRAASQDIGPDDFTEELANGKTVMSDLIKSNPALKSSHPMAKIFPRLPESVFALDLSKPELMRLSVLYEWLETENEYIRDLQLLLEFFKDLLLDTNGISEDESVIIFGSIPQLIEASEEIVQQFKNRQSESATFTNIGCNIQDYCSKLTIYVNYAGTYVQAMRIVRLMHMDLKKKQILAALMAAPESRGLSFESFLIKPIQRLCKYPLLLRELCKYTDQTGQEYTIIKETADQLDSIVGTVNESTNKTTEQDRVQSVLAKIDIPMNSIMEYIEDTYLKEGLVMIGIGSIKPVERYIVLLQKRMLVCRAHPTSTKYKYELLAHYPSNEITVILNKDNNPRTVKQFILSMFADRTEIWTIQCSSEEEKKKWEDIYLEMTKSYGHEPKQMLTADTDASREKRNSISKIVKPSKLTKGLLRKTNVTNSTEMVESTNNSINDVESLLTPNFMTVQPPAESPIIQIQGQSWKLVYSILGKPYYYNVSTKESVWEIPGYSSGDKKEKMTCMAVENQPDWRRVERKDDGLVYFFNIQTLETRWNLE